MKPKPASPRGANARPMFQVPLSPDERAKLQRAADAAHLPLATWIRSTCLQAAERKRSPAK